MITGEVSYFWVGEYPSDWRVKSGLSVWENCLKSIFFPPQQMWMIRKQHQRPLNHINKKWLQAVKTTMWASLFPQIRVQKRRSSIFTFFQSSIQSKNTSIKEVEAKSSRGAEERKFTRTAPLAPSARKTSAKRRENATFSWFLPWIFTCCSCFPPKLCHLQQWMVCLVFGTNLTDVEEFRPQKATAMF